MGNKKSADAPVSGDQHMVAVKTVAWVSATLFATARRLVVFPYN